jgi:monovalent cation/proton antiporter MnhG/PhaG subunit
MMPWLSSLFLVGGAALCLLAAAGVLRLPDFFMRMHAATKAGVVGCGLVLIGAGCADGTTGTWVKVGIALVFLLLTTPVAGHLLGRAAYVGGAPLWQGTASDDLRTVLPRGEFGAGLRAARDTDPRSVSSDSVILALAQGPQMEAAVRQAIALARRRGTELCGLAIIDVPRLCNVGPVPIGAGWHAQQMRERRIRLARQAAADVIERFEEMARASGLRWAVRLEEGRPAKILAKVAQPGCVLAVAPGGWFDQGVLDLEVDVRRRLRWSGLRRDIVVLGARPDNVAG